MSRRVLAYRQCEVMLPNGERCPKAVYVSKWGWCSGHYTAWRRYGDPLGGPGKRGRRRDQPIYEDDRDGSLYVVACNNGMIIAFDQRARCVAEEFTLTSAKVKSKATGLITWYAVTSYAAEAGEKQGPRDYFHIMINKPLPAGLTWDHIDHDGCNDRDINMRAVTASVQSANRRKIKTINGKPTSSEYDGVDWSKQRGMWRARVKKEGVEYLAGYFHDQIDAAVARDMLKIELFGPITSLNFPL